MKKPSKKEPSHEINMKKQLEELDLRTLGVITSKERKRVRELELEVRLILESIETIAEAAFVDISVGVDEDGKYEVTFHATK